jgi:glycosidase
LALLWLLKLTLGGTPLFFMGEELGTEIPFKYRNKNHWPSDSRFVKRVTLDDVTKNNRHLAETKEGRLFRRLKEYIRWRKEEGRDYLGRAPTFFDTGSDSVLGFTKRDDKNNRTIYFYANCSNQDRYVKLDIPPGRFVVSPVGPSRESLTDLATIWVGGKKAFVVVLEPYGFYAVAAEEEASGAS